MGNRNSLNEFSKYIEDLCRSHTVINHSDEETHFLELGNDQQLQKQKRLYTPCVTLEKLENSYSDQSDNIRKKKHVEIMFLDKVSDAGDFDKINLVWNEMEWVGEDFLKQIRLGQRSRNVSLHKLKLSGAEMHLVENVATNMWGVLLSFEIELQFDECIQPGRFR